MQAGACVQNLAPTLPTFIVVDAAQSAIPDPPVAHGIVVVNAFCESVNRHRVEGRELGADKVVDNLVLEFKPRPTQDMLVACPWSRWSAPGEPGLSGHEHSGLGSSPCQR